MNACKRSQQPPRFRIHSIRFPRHLPSWLVRSSATPTRRPAPCVQRTEQRRVRIQQCDFWAVDQAGWCGEPWIQSCRRYEENVEETIGEEQVEKAVVEDVHMEDRPSVAYTEVPEAPGASALEGEHVESSHPQAELVLARTQIPASNNTQQQLGPPSSLLRPTLTFPSKKRRPPTWATHRMTESEHLLVRGSILLWRIFSQDALQVSRYCPQMEGCAFEML